MAASYLEASLDRLGTPVQRDDTIEICINPDGQVWGEFQGDHFMQGLGAPLTRMQRQTASAVEIAATTRAHVVGTHAHIVPRLTCVK